MKDTSVTTEESSPSDRPSVFDVTRRRSSAMR